MSKKVGVVTFPGSNCDRDIVVAFQRVGAAVSQIWHKDSNLAERFDIIVIPGGFSYGDYLRCGALAAKSNIMQEIVKFANSGGFVLGICNGFQILTESGLLPGVLLRNKNLKFISKKIELEIVNNSKFTEKYQKNTITIPIAHMEGNYFCEDDCLKELEDNAQIAFRYIDNPNGAKANIAGIYNKQKNVLGMMPHPERSTDILSGGLDGLSLFESLIS